MEATPKILIETPTSRLWTIEQYTEDLYDDLKDLEALEDPAILVHGRWGKQNRDVAFYARATPTRTPLWTLRLSTPIRS